MENSKSHVISQKTKDLIDKLVLGKLSLPEIAKVTGVSEQWLENYVNSKYDFISLDVLYFTKKSEKLI